MSQGKRQGIAIKVETNGSGGAKNILTDEEIANCDGIIVAADKTVEMARFDGKKVIRTKVSDGIKIPEELINRIEDGEAPVYHHEGDRDSHSVASGNDESFGRKLYKHLMNGVSNMLPFTVAGGIFIALAFLIDSLGGAPQDGDFGTHLAAAAWFKSIGGYAFNFMIPILAGYIGGLAIVAIMMCAVNPVMGMLNEGLANFLTNMGDTSKILLQKQIYRGGA